MQGMDASDGRLLVSPAPSCYQVYACGPFLLKRWNGTSYQSVPVGAWGGSHSPRLLLKVLLASPERQASRGRLLEILWPAIEPEEAGKYLNDAAYRLRAVLRPTKGAESLLLTATDTSSYALVGQERLWVDADAALSLLEQADECEQQGGDVLPFLEEAAGYLSRGEFLVEEEHIFFYGRRARVARARRGCLLAQARVSALRGWLRRGEALLSSLLEENPLDEDALCALMLNLHQQGRTSEGLRLYEETKGLLEREGLTPTEATRATEQRLRSESPRGEKLLAYTTAPSPSYPLSILNRIESTRASTLYSEKPLNTLHSLGQNLTQGIKIEQNMLSSPLGADAWSDQLGLALLASLFAEIGQHLGNGNGHQAEELSHSSTAQVTGGIINERVLLLIQLLESYGVVMNGSRRLLLQQTLSALCASTLLPAHVFDFDLWDRIAFALARPSSIDEQTLSGLERLNETCWSLSNASQLMMVEQIIPIYLPKLAMLAHQSGSPYQQRVASLASRGYILAAEVDKNNVKAMQAYSQLAVLYSQIAEEDYNVQVDALRQEATIALVAKDPLKSLQTYQRTLPLINRVSSLLRSRVYLGLACAYARCGQKEEALRSLGLAYEHFPANPESDPQFLYMYISGNKSVLHLYEALTYIDLNLPKEAGTALARVNGLQPKIPVTESARIEFLNLQAKTAATLGNMDESCAYLQASVAAADRAGYGVWRKEATDVYQELVKTWPHEPRLRQLGGLFCEPRNA